MTSRRFAQCAMAMFAFGLAFAQQTPDNAAPDGAPPASAPIPPSEDPPGRAARLSYITGTVSFQPGGVDDWVPATPNRPLTTGDRLWTETGSRAELTTGNATLRLNARTNFTFLNLNNNTTQIQVSSGSLGIRVRRLDGNEVFEIDTPQTAFTVLRAGDYRVDVNEQGDTTIATVHGGQAEAVATDNRVVPMGPRTQARIAVTADAAPVIDTRDAPVADNFDNFCQERDRREDRSESAHYVSREVPGYADLDDHGVWTENPQYGMVWAPRVDPGWAPYQTGHWAWISPWGWTWVDDEPWGYAPFHYGRWAYTPAGWVWVPGPPAIRPVYAPALVAWVGGPRFGVSIGVGVGPAVGWFALGPGEVWVPAYRASPAYFSRVNVSNTVIVNQVHVTNVYNATYVNRTAVTNVTYANQRVNGAVMAVPQSAMVSGRPVSQAAIRVPQDSAGSWQVQQTAAVAPQRAAVLGGRQAGAAAPPSSMNNRTLMARATPPAATVPFERQQSALQANPGQPVNRTALRQLQPASAPAASPAVTQHAQIRQLSAPPAARVSSAPAPAAVRPSASQPRTENGPPLGRSTETVAPRAIPSTPQPQTQASTPSTSRPEASHVTERPKAEPKSKEKPKHEEKKDPKKE